MRHKVNFKWILTGLNSEFSLTGRHVAFDSWQSRMFQLCKQNDYKVHLCKQAEAAHVNQSRKNNA